MGDVYGVRRTIVVGSRIAAEMVARKQGGVVTQLYPCGCTLSGQKIKYSYAENGHCHIRTVRRSVHNVRSVDFQGGVYGEATICGRVHLVESWAMDAEGMLTWYTREEKAGA